MALRSPSARLRQAVQENDLALVHRLRYKTDLRNTDTTRRTSLAYAALCCAEDVFEWLLLDAGHDEEELTRDADNSTVLHMLASLPCPLTPSTIKPPEAHRAAVRMSNMYFDEFPYLIDWSNASGKTALHVAAQSGNVELVRNLCDLGADLNLPDLQGNSPLHYASAWNQLPVILALLSYPHLHISARNNAAFTALDYAYSVGLQTHMNAAIKDVYEARRQRKLLGSRSRDGEAGPSWQANGAGPGRTSSFISEDSAARGHRQQLRAKASMGTLLSEESAGGSGRGSDVSYNGPKQATPPHPGPWSSPNGLAAHEMPSHLTRSPVSVRSGVVGRGGDGSPSLRGEAPRRGDSALSPTASPGRHRSNSYRSQLDGGLAVDMSRLAVAEAARRSPSKNAHAPPLSPVSDLPSLGPPVATAPTTASLAPPPPGRSQRDDRGGSGSRSPVLGHSGGVQDVGLGVGPVPPPRP